MTGPTPPLTPAQGAPGIHVLRNGDFQGLVPDNLLERYGFHSYLPAIEPDMLI